MQNTKIITVFLNPVQYFIVKILYSVDMGRGYAESLMHQ